MYPTRRIVISTTICITVVLGLFISFRSNQSHPSEQLKPQSTSSLYQEIGSTASSTTMEAAAATRVANGEHESVGPISAHAKLLIAGKTIALESLDGEFARVSLEGGEVIEITLRPQRFTLSKPVRIDADNGGSLNRRQGPVEAMTAAGNGEISFTYALGEHRGLYTVEISQGPMRELFEFWVGPEPPQGDPGPTRIFSASSTQS